MITIKQPFSQIIHFNQKRNPKPPQNALHLISPYLKPTNNERVINQSKPLKSMFELCISFIFQNMCVIQLPMHYNQNTNSSLYWFRTVVDHLKMYIDRESERWITQYIQNPKTIHESQYSDLYGRQLSSLCWCWWQRVHFTKAEFICDIWI